MTNGTFQLEDLILNEFRNVYLAGFGFDKLAQAIQERADRLNAAVSEQLQVLTEKSEKNRAIYGTSEKYTMSEVDELGVAKSQKQNSGVEVGFPMRKFSVTTGFTNDFLQRASVYDLAKKSIGVQDSYIRRIQDELTWAMFAKANYSFVDTYGDGTTLAVKRFLNADSTKIPDSPNGTVFTGSSHQHYVGTVGAALAYSDVDTLIANVVEHLDHSRGVVLFCDSAMVTTLKGLAGTKFMALTKDFLIPANTSDSTVAKLDTTVDLNNAFVGYWDNTPVWTRVYMPSGYVMCAATQTSDKPLVYRVEKIAGLQGLISLPEYGMHPLTAKTNEAFFGFGAFNRSAVAILDTGHQTTYSNPSGMIR